MAGPPSLAAHIRAKVSGSAAELILPIPGRTALTLLHFHHC